jgi:hypothetical protein
MRSTRQLLEERHDSMISSGILQAEAVDFRA